MWAVIQEHVQIILRIFYVDSNCKQYKLLVTMWTAVLYDSSPAWVLLCCFKSPKMANFLLHCKHVNCSSEYEFFHVFQITRKCNFFVTVWAAEWFFTCMIYMLHTELFQNSLQRWFLPQRRVQFLISMILALIWAINHICTCRFIFVYQN